jgi:hypothetical protein
MNVYLPYIARLPSAYQEVEYIQSSWTQRISTWYNSNANVKIVTEFSNLYNSQDVDNVIIWTSATSWWWTRPLCFYSRGDSYLWYHFGNNIDFELNHSDKHRIEYINNKVIMDWVTKNWDWSQSFSNKEITLFYWNTKGWYTKMYMAQIYDNWTLVRDFVPCYRKSDSVIWLYDLVNNQFYTNSWTWTFSKGNDVTMAELKNDYIWQYS